jgi:SH3-like domain-containing protein
MQKINFFPFLIFLFSFELVHAKDEYFRTLRYEKVNLRQGPGKDYPIKIFYKKKFLPVIIQDSSDNFRKIRDHENNSGWIHISQLSKKKAAIVTDNDLIMFSSATIYSNPVVILKKGKLVKIDKCKNNWCKIKSDKFKGWVKNSSLWGLF